MTAIDLARIGQRRGLRNMYSSMFQTPQGYGRELVSTMNLLLNPDDMSYTLNDLEYNYNQMSTRKRSRFWKDLIYKLQQDTL